MRAGARVLRDIGIVVEIPWGHRQRPSTEVDIPNNRACGDNLIVTVYGHAVSILERHGPPCRRREVLCPQRASEGRVFAQKDATARQGGSASQPDSGPIKSK